MQLNRKVVLSVLLFSFVFLTIFNGQGKSSTSSTASNGAKASVPAAHQHKASGSKRSAKTTAKPKGATSPIPQAEVDSIVKEFESTFVSATNRGDAKELAELYTPGTTFLNEAGGLAEGRDTLQRVWTAAFTNTGRPTIQVTPHKSTAISKTVIVTIGVLRITPIDDTPQDTFYTKVLTMDGGRWRIAAMQYAQPNPWNVTFPPTPVGESSSKTVSLINTGTTELKIARWGITGKHAANFMETNNCKAPIPPAGSCSITFTFHPLATGTPKAYLSFWDDGATGRHQIRLKGSSNNTIAQ